MSALTNYIEQTAKMDRILASFTRPAYASIADTFTDWSDIIEGPVRKLEAVSTPWERYLTPHPALTQPDPVGQAMRSTLDQVYGVNEMTRRALDLVSRNAFLDSYMSKWPVGATDASLDIPFLDGDTAERFPDWDQLAPVWAQEFIEHVGDLPQSEQLALAVNLASVFVTLAAAVFAWSELGTFPGVLATGSLLVALGYLVVRIMALYEDDE